MTDVSSSSYSLLCCVLLLEWCRWAQYTHVCINFCSHWCQGADYTAWTSTLSISSNLLGSFRCLRGNHEQHFASSWVSSLNLNWISWSNDDKYWDFRAQLQVAMSNTVLDITDLEYIFALHISFSWYGDVHTLGLTQLQPYFTDSLMHFLWGRAEFEATLI